MVTTTGPKGMAWSSVRGGLVVGSAPEGGGHGTAPRAEGTA